MGDRLKDQVAIVLGAGQSQGETVGNGRATAILFAREGAKVVIADKDVVSARETQKLIENEIGEICSVHEVDVCSADQCKTLVDDCLKKYGKIDIFHNNVGIGVGDGSPVDTSEKVWDTILDVNLKGMFLAAKFVLPVMQEAKKGVLTFISSVAAVCSMNMVAYKTSKAGVNALSQSIAIAYAQYGIRCNVIMPGLLDTPIAIEGLARHHGLPKDVVREQRNRQVPLRNQMGTAWDVAYASVFLASEEAKFITGVALPVDGGQSARVGFM